MLWPLCTFFQGTAELFVDIYSKLNFVVIVFLRSWFSCFPPRGNSGKQPRKVAGLSTGGRTPPAAWGRAEAPRKPATKNSKSITVRGHFLLGPVDPTHCVDPCCHHWVTEAYDNVACHHAKIKLCSGQKLCLPISRKSTMTLLKIVL